MLHNDKELFEQTVLRTADAFGIEAGIIEKDYYVTMLLKEIVSVQPNIIFKGGTSLSKCFKLIKRFSEDIDLNIMCEGKPTEGMRRHLKDNIVISAEKLNLPFLNPEATRSRRDFNRYLFGYDTTFKSGYLKQNVIVETAVFFRSYPTVIKPASCLIYDYLSENGFSDIISEYVLEPFEVCVQSCDRTLIDKLFAIGDYYLSGTTDEHSRHIYDIYKLLGVVEINDKLRELAAAVREERKGHAACLSAADDVDMNALLREIADKEIYRKDYENTTQSLLFEKVTYPEAAKALETIIESKIF